MSSDDDSISMSLDSTALFEDPIIPHMSDTDRSTAPKMKRIKKQKRHISTSSDLQNADNLHKPLSKKQQFPTCYQKTNQSLNNKKTFNKTLPQC